MSNDWRFDPEDLGNGGSEDEDGDGGTSSGSRTSLGTGVFLLPLSIIGVYAVVERGVVLGSMQGIVGSGGLALAITNAFLIVGLLTVGVVCILAALTITNLIAGLIKANGANALLGLLGVLYFVAGYAGSTMLFGGVPLLVGFVLTTNLMIYGAVVLLVLVVGTAASIIM